MPAPDQATLDRRGAIIVALRRIVPGEGVIETAAELRAYETDGLTAYRQMPMVVVLPETVEQVSRVLAYATTTVSRWCRAARGTSLVRRRAAACRRCPARHGEFNRILDIDYDNRCVVVAARRHQSRASPGRRAAGFYYAPDPSSPDRLHDRRQCRGKFRRRALPQIRPDHQQRARHRNGADRPARSSGSAASISTARATISWAS